MPSTPELTVSNPLVTIEASSTTRVLCVEWIIPEPPPRNGEWVVEWDSMYASLSTDLNSARSEKGSYFALQHSSSTPNALSPQQRAAAAWVDRQSEDLPTAPLSTAKLIQFENRKFETDSDDDLPAFFSGRPIVQAPTHITPVNGGKVYFLLKATAALPETVRVLFLPTWTPPVVLAEIPVPAEHQSGSALHAAWAEHRLADLKILEDIAKELEHEGARGLGTGRVKVGVEGGGMDEEAVRREGWMVREEVVWVSETFPNNNPPSPHSHSPDTQPLLKEGLKLATSVGPSYCTSENAGDSPAESEGDGLFALPLSPRSPEMAMSPFSMFRGEPLARQNSNLSQVLVLEQEDDVTPTGNVGLGLGLGIVEGFPPTPPAEAKGSK